MKKFLFLSLFLFCTLAGVAQSQQVTLKFMGQSTDSIRIQMEYVEVKNLSSDSTLWADSLVLEWPDTTLTMTTPDSVTSVHDYVAAEGFAFTHMGPNPFNGQTEVALQLPENGDVLLRVYELTGKEVAAFSGSFPQGVHRFQVNVAQTQTYLVVAQCGTKRASIKLVNAGHGHGNRIAYLGLAFGGMISPKMEVADAFHYGDTLMCAGYVHFGDSLYASDTVLLIMDSLQDSLQNVVLTFPVSLPSVVTWIPDTITDRSAFVGGTVINNGGILVGERGIVWANHPNVTLEDNRIPLGDTLIAASDTLWGIPGDFSTALDALQPNTPCFVRAYAMTGFGLSFGQEYVFVTISQLRDNQPCSVANVTDADGNVYATVRIGRQCWTRENLRTTRYNDSVSVTNVNDLEDMYIYHIDSLFETPDTVFTYDTTIMIDSIIIPYDTAYNFYFDTTVYIHHQNDVYLFGEMSVDVFVDQKDTLYSAERVDSLVQYFIPITLVDSVNQSFVVYDQAVVVNQQIPASVEVFINVLTDSTDMDSLVYQYDTVTVFSYTDSVAHNDTIALIDSLIPYFNLDTVTHIAYQGNILVDGISNFDVKVDITVSQIDTIITRHSDTLALIDHITTTYISTHNGYVPHHDTTFVYEVVLPADTLYDTLVSVVDTTVNFLFSGLDTTAIDTITIYSDTIAYCYYPDSTAVLADVYGLLYNYRAASGELSDSIVEPSGIQGICPEGWHIPSIGEWEQLTGYLEGQSAYHAGGISTNISKALASTDNWQQDTTYNYSVGNRPENNNATGFSALPAGSYTDTVAMYGRFWSCSGEQPTELSVLRLSYNLPNVAFEMIAPDSVASVRCVRDDEETADGFACPGMPTVTDADGNVYNTVQVGSQCWMKENLRTTRYPDNAILTEGTELSDSIAYYYLPSTEESEIALYGVLYNWTAAVAGSAQGICPIGWHVPTADEWMELHRYVASKSEYLCGSGPNSISKALASNYGWRPSISSCDTGDTTTVHNATGFSALPTGRYPDNHIGVNAYFWTSTEVSNANATVRYLNYSTSNFSEGSIRKEYAASVRCLKD